MKTLFLLLLISESLFCKAGQIPLLELTSDGVPPVVVKVDSTLSAEVLYKRALDWVKKYYENPDMVIKSKDEGSMIRIEAYNDAFFYRENPPNTIPSREVYGLNYILEISFKNGRYKFDFQPDDKLYVNHGALALFTVYDLVRDKDIYGKSYQQARESFTKRMNSINESLHNYLTGNKTGDW